ncbi:hypothetical protein Tdes44962_MAKER08607 [Teratosphaeria destructans]|uniref:Uncharacterized protein n=1 Tax=Teratosphaeria destructans TaxID=418781 RepID=A0A9W7SWA4_9PEZI|nr:hypothetical protein Tdes44962_MAKER08607 [Teratosphaeria destructans]
MEEEEEEEEEHCGAAGHGSGGETRSSTCVDGRERGMKARRSRRVGSWEDAGSGVRGRRSITGG